MNRAATAAGTDRRYAFVSLGFAVLVWGTTPRVTAIGGPHTDPVMLTALRAAPTALVLLLVLPVLRYRMPGGAREWLFAGVSGLLMVTVFLGGFTEAIVRAGPGNAVVLASTSPFFVVLLERVFLGERVSLQTLAGLCVGFAGVVLVVWTQLGGESAGSDLAVGLAFALAAAAAWASGTVMVKQQVVRKASVDLVGLTTGQFLVGGLVLVALAFGVGGIGGTEWSSGELWLSVAYISIVGCAIATLAYFRALRRLSATTVTTGVLLSPVVAVLLEIALGHVPEAIVLGGMGVTIAGVAMVTLAAQREPDTVPAARATL